MDEGTVETERWRGQTTESLRFIRLEIDGLRGQMNQEHIELRKQVLEFEGRLKPLEQLRIFMAGIGMACIVAIPVIWLYASRVNALLDKVEKIIPLSK